MLHTAKFCINNLTNDETHLIEKNMGTTLDQFQQKIDRKFEGSITTWVINQYGFRLFFIVDFVKLLGKSDIQEKDYAQAEEKIEKFVLYLFHDESFIDRVSLVRIDYRWDVKLLENERKLLFYLYKKGTSKYRHQRKYDLYQTTVYYNSKSVQCCCYDKEEEAKTKRGFVDSHEEGVLRFEVRLMNQHLKYKKYRQGKEKCLREYFQEELFNQYMANYFEEILFRGDYYKITKARSIINDSCLKTGEKEKLIKYLSYVSNYGIDSARKKYSKYHSKKFTNQLEILRINVILIPKNRKEFPSFMKNPLSSLPKW